MRTAGQRLVLRTLGSLSVSWMLGSAILHFFRTDLRFLPLQVRAARAAPVVASRRLPLVSPTLVGASVRQFSAGTLYGVVCTPRSQNRVPPLAAAVTVMNVPGMGDSITSGTIVKWEKSERLGRRVGCVL